MRAPARRRWAALTTFIILGCSGDTKPPPGMDGGPGDGTGGEGALLDSWWYPDGADPLCPLPGPCVIESRGEGKHHENLVVIGERLTLVGRELQDVDTVYIGSAVAPILSTSATEVVCRVGPRTPPGKFSVEVKAGSNRRKFDLTPTVRRLLIVAAADFTQLQTFDSISHSAGAVLGLGEAPVDPPSLSATGRYLISQGAVKLSVLDLALETATEVSGLGGETVTSWTTDDVDRTLLLATASGKVFVVDLSAFPTLTASAAAGAPATVALLGWGQGQIVGLHPTAGAGEGSLWISPADLSAVSWVKTAGGSLLLLGSGADLAPLSLAGGEGRVAVLALDGAIPQLGLLQESQSSLVGGGTAGIQGARGAVVAAGGTHVALSSEKGAPALSYSSTSDPLDLKSVVLDGSGTSWTIALRLPTLPARVAALVGPKPTASFEADILEVVDLAQGVRLTSSGKAALELAGMRDAAGDPVVGVVHLITSAELRSYELVPAGTAVMVTDKHPHMILTAGKDYRFLLVQP